MNQLVLALVNFILRRVLIQTMGVTYVGVDGLFSNILSLLGLVESGFGTAIVFSLYLPIAQGDEKKIVALVNFYSKVYRIIAITILFLGICFLPALKFIIKDNPFTTEETMIYYLLFLLNNVASYFLAYKTSFLMACQKQYLVSMTTMIANGLFAVLRIIVLIFWKNYVIFLFLIIINTVMVNVVVAQIVEKKYKYINSNNKNELSIEEKNSLFSNVKALLWHKIGTYVLNGTDNIVISYFVGIVSVGIYSNYILITRTLTQFINQLFNAIVPAMGDIIAEDSQTGENRAYSTYKSIYYLSFILYGTSTIILAALLQPFIKLWIGEEYTVSALTVIFLVLNFYFSGMRTVPSTTKSAAGIYKQDRYSPICESIINLVLSVTLVHFIGMAGVIVGTLMSNLLMPFWTAPYYLYRDLFKKRFREYLYSSSKYFLITLAGVCIVNYLNSLVPFGSGLRDFVFMMLFSSLSALFYMLIIVLLSNEKKMLKPYINNLIIRISYIRKR